MIYIREDCSNPSSWKYYIMNFHKVFIYLLKFNQVYLNIDFFQTYSLTYFSSKIKKNLISIQQSFQFFEYFKRGTYFLSWSSRRWSSFEGGKVSKCSRFIFITISNYFLFLKNAKTKKRSTESTHRCWKYDIMKRSYPTVSVCPRNSFSFWI